MIFNLNNPTLQTTKFIRRITRMSHKACNCGSVLISVRMVLVKFKTLSKLAEKTRIGVRQLFYGKQTTSIRKNTISQEMNWFLIVAIILLTVIKLAR